MKEEAQGEHDHKLGHPGNGAAEWFAKKALAFRQGQDVIYFINVEGAVTAVAYSIQPRPPAPPDDHFTVMRANIVAIAPYMGGNDVGRIRNLW